MDDTSTTTTTSSSTTTTTTDGHDDDSTTTTSTTTQTFSNEAGDKEITVADRNQTNTAQNVERRGEITADKGATAKILGEEGQTMEELQDEAKAEAVANHEAEHADDDEFLAKQDGRV